MFALLIAAIAFWIWNGSRLHIVDHTSPPLTTAEAKALGCLFQFPASARNVQWKKLYTPFGIGHCEMIRFEAPLADCRAAAAVWGKNNIGDPTVPHTLEPLPDIRYPVNNTFGQFESWFRPDLIAHGETIGRNPQVWIDDDSGIFYFRATD